MPSKTTTTVSNDEMKGLDDWRILQQQQQQQSYGLDNNKAAKNEDDDDNEFNNNKAGDDDDDKKSLISLTWRRNLRLNNTSGWGITGWKGRIIRFKC